MRAATDRTKPNVHGCVPIKLYLYRQAVGQIWPASCGLQTTELKASTAPRGGELDSIPGWGPSEESATIFKLLQLSVG